MAAEDESSAAGGSSLLDLLTPVMRRVFALPEALQEGAHDPKTATRLHTELFNRLRQVRDQARQSGRTDADIYAAIYAVAAWIDDRLGREEGWKGRVPALTATLFKSAKPAEEFLDRLGKLGRSQTEARAVFVTVLGLGYGAGDADPVRAQELARLKAAQGAQLDPPAIDPDSLVTDPLTPQPYRLGDPAPAAAPVGRRRSRLPQIAAGLVLIVLAGGAAWWGLRPATRVAGPEIDRLRGVVELVASDYACARIATHLRDDGVVEVSGYVSSDGDRQRLVNSLANIEQVAGVVASVRVYERPFCEVVGVLAEFASVEPGRPGMPGLILDNPSYSYALGDNLIVHAIATSRFRGYLYVDLVNVEGDVAHLLPEPLAPNNLVAAGGEVTLGVAPEQARINDRRWTIERPAGRRMLVAIATPVPLFEDLRPLHEPVGSYLPALRDSLRSLASLGRETALPAAFVFFETRAPDAAAAGPTN